MTVYIDNRGQQVGFRAPSPGYHWSTIPGRGDNVYEVPNGNSVPLQASAPQPQLTNVEAYSYGVNYVQNSTPYGGFSTADDLGTFGAHQGGKASFGHESGPTVPIYFGGPLATGTAFVDVLGFSNKLVTTVDKWFTEKRKPTMAELSDLLASAGGAAKGVMLAVETWAGALGVDKVYESAGFAQSIPLVGMITNIFKSINVEISGQSSDERKAEEWFLLSCYLHPIADFYGKIDASCVGLHEHGSMTSFCLYEMMAKYSRQQKVKQGNRIMTHIMTGIAIASFVVACIAMPIGVGIGAVSMWVQRLIKLLYKTCRFVASTDKAMDLFSKMRNTAASQSMLTASGRPFSILVEQAALTADQLNRSNKQFYKRGMQKLTTNLSGNTFHVGDTQILATYMGAVDSLLSHLVFENASSRSQNTTQAVHGDLARIMLNHVGGANSYLDLAKKFYGLTDWVVFGG